MPLKRTVVVIWILIDALLEACLAEVSEDFEVVVRSGSIWLHVVEFLELADDEFIQVAILV